MTLTQNVIGVAKDRRDICHTSSGKQDGITMRLADLVARRDNLVTNFGRESNRPGVAAGPMCACRTWQRLPPFA